METLTEPMVSVTLKAKERLEALRAEEGYDPSFGIRVEVKGGGCSGLSYDLTFDNAEKPGDHVFEDNGLRIYVGAKSLLYLIGTQLDFTDGLNGKGFAFQNPNASRTCACGESFAV
jgi:iron-sulfur cluster assembly protein